MRAFWRYGVRLVNSRPSVACAGNVEQYLRERVGGVVTTFYCTDFYGTNVMYQDSFTRDKVYNC